MKTGFLVCSRTCLDTPNQQLRPRILPPDPVPVFNPRPENFAYQNGLQGFTLYTIDPPTVASGPVFSEAYVLAQVAALSGIATPGGITDYSSFIVASQVAQTLVPADLSRVFLLIFNPTFAPLAVSFGEAAFNAVTSIILNTGQALFWSSSQTPAPTISASAMTIAGFYTESPEGYLVDVHGNFLVDANGNYIISSYGGQAYYAWQQ